MDEFVQYMLDVFRMFGPITLRRMFAGYGIFHNGIMFGLVYDKILYLKVDSENVRDFEQQGLKQFGYARQGRLVGLSYYQAPEVVLEDPQEATLWARRSFEAARRAGFSKPRRRKHNSS